MDGELKFGGEMYDLLDTKLIVFDDLCKTADVHSDIYDRAYSTMLKEAALDCLYNRPPPLKRKPKQEGWRRYMREEGEGSSEADFITYLMGYEGIDVGEWNDDHGTNKDNFDTWYAWDSG